MKHEMRLHSGPFDLIKNGTKTIELRLYDEKRKLIKENDIKDPKDMEIYYSKEKQCQYGVVGIEIELI